MLPIYFIDLADTSFAKDVAKRYFEDQYPQTEDCALLPKQVSDLKIDLENINKRISSNQKEIEGLEYIKVPCAPTTGVSMFSDCKQTIICSSSDASSCVPTWQKRVKNPDYLKAEVVRTKSKLIVEELIRRKEILINLACGSVVTPDTLVNPNNQSNSELAPQTEPLQPTTHENTPETQPINSLINKSTFVEKIKKLENWKKGLIVLSIIGSTYLGYKLIKK